MTICSEPIDESMLDAFIKFNSHDATRVEKECAAWANDAVDQMVEVEPEKAWLFIIAVIEKDEGRHCAPMLAAGAFERLMSLHGENYIDRVELMSRQSPAFRWMLGGVWKCGMSNELWNRFQSIPGKPKW